MSITRWEPWGDMMTLRDAMDSLIAESFVRPRGEFMGTGGAMRMPLDVREQENEFIVSASVPGVSPNDVEISVLGDTLRISGERREEHEEQREGQRWLMREQRFGSFERTVTLPRAIKADQANAEFKDGVLKITLPKAEEAKTKRIPVRAGGESQEVEVGAGQERAVH